MVMGSGRLLFKSASISIGSLRLSTLLYIIALLLAINSVLARASSRCTVDQCSQTYEKSIRRLEAKSLVEEAHTRSQCRIFRRLHRCLQRTRKACRGNLLFHAIEHLSKKGLQNANCSQRHKPQLNPELLPQPDKPSTKAPADNTTAAPTTPFPGEVTEGSACTYSDKPNYRHCGMFGDPHLRTFWDEFFTCNIENAWPLINNDYLVVMATNVPVKEGSSATVTTKISVVIRAAGECADQRHYVATSDTLPRSFVDGTVETGARGSVFIDEVIPGRHVEIKARFIATTIVIRQVGNYLTFAIRMPEELVRDLSSSWQLCDRGCPAEYQISPAMQIQKLHKVIDEHKTRKSNVPSKSEHPNLEHKEEVDEESKNNRLPPTAQNIESRRHFTEEEARIKCKQIILAATEKPDTSNEVEDEDSNDQTPNISANEDSDENSNRLSSSVSSQAFSSLMPSSNQNSRRGRRKNRMAAASRPEAEISQSRPEMSHSSFRQLQGSQESPDDAILPNKAYIRRRRNRQRRKKKSKRHVNPNQNQRKDEAKEGERTVPCAPKATQEKPPFNFYFDSCVFDLVTTGNTNFTLAARAALEDVRRTHALRDDAPGASLEVVKLWEPVVTGRSGCPTADTASAVETSTHGHGSAERPAFTMVMILCVAISCIYANYASWLFCSSINTVATASKQHQLWTDKKFCKSAQRTRTLRVTTATT